DGVGAVDPLAQFQLFHHNLVLGIQFAVDYAVVQVEVQPALTDTVAGEFARVGRQSGQFHPLELGGDVQASQRIERIQAAGDGDWRVAVDVAAHIDARRLLRLTVDRADL